jgi:hypothetical protein
MSRFRDAALARAATTGAVTGLPPLPPEQVRQAEAMIPLEHEPNEPFGDCGGIGEAPSHQEAVTTCPWPQGVDWHLTRDAARLSGLVAHGASWRWCPGGALEVVQPHGARWTLLPARAAALLQASLLPEAIVEAAP